ncbi:MAG: hypothetical protein ABEJ88_09300 [Halobacterium sp.]
MDRADALAAAWLYVGAGLAATGLLRGYGAGGLDVTGLFLGGAFLLIFGLRDVVLRENREMKRHRDSLPFLAITVVALAVVTYSLATTAAGVL